MLDCVAASEASGQVKKQQKVALTTLLALFSHLSHTISQQEGPLAFYKGWLPSVIGVVPYVGLNFGVYETLKHMLLLHYGLKDERDLSVAARLACGAAAGTTGQTVAYPFDVARRRLQVRCGLGCAQSKCSMRLCLSA